MSLNCLTCQRTNSLRGGIEAAITVGRQKAKAGRTLRRNHAAVERSWSGNLVPRLTAGNNNGSGAGAASNPGLQKVERGGVSRRRHRHSGPVEYEPPRLVRSSGMRRDWSFEDLR
ncbi:PREDICTED: uncharacterized protein LOC109153269 [Ipomoea nil]|uniref:uncharacterized protein LOC109153269 n=1 Tax=Ipomoea nil TaxID=35883 RepID=UPI000901FBEB|nr:PREDICTED: uncharacterized protein LOC109153269 [Ipomoea nil]